MARTAFQKAIKKLPDRASLAQWIICRKDGTVVFKESFFHKHGRDAYVIATRIAEALKANNIPAEEIISERAEVYRSWPKMSYWVCAFKPVEESSNV